MDSIKYIKLNPKAHAPSRGTGFSAGADLYALTEEPLIINPHTTVFVHTGIAVAIPEGYCGMICARSGIASKRGLAPANKVGIIDSDYRGELIVALHNHSESTGVIAPEERIAQLLIMPVMMCDYIECDDLDATVRGNGGFGSTGK